MASEVDLERKHRLRATWQDPSKASLALSGPANPAMRVTGLLAGDAQSPGIETPKKESVGLGVFTVGGALTAASIRCASSGRAADATTIHPNVAQRIRAYLDAAGRADDLDGPMFRPLSHNRKGQESRRHMDPDAIDRVLRKHAAASGLTRGFRRIPCARPSSRRLWRTARRSMMCSARPGMPSLAPPSSTISAAIIRRGPPAFLRRTDVPISLRFTRMVYGHDLQGQ